MKGKIIKLCSIICLFFMDQNSDSANSIGINYFTFQNSTMGISGRNLGVWLDNIHKNNTIIIYYE